MANWKDIKQNTEGGFYNDAEFIDIKDLVGTEFDVKDVTPFENDKGPGIASLIILDDKERRLVTHSIGVTKVLGSEEFMTALKDLGTITVALKEGKSKKSGKYFYYID